MKQSNLTLPTLFAEVARLNKLKRDFIHTTKGLAVEPRNGGIHFHIAGVAESFALTKHTHSQVATWAGIGKPYYDKMLAEAPELLSENVNTWLHKQSTNRMVRTLEGNARAFLSDRYRIIDHYDLLTGLMPFIMENKDKLTVRSCDVTPNRLYLKVIVDELQGEVKVGDIVRSGWVLSNGEIGNGSIMVAPFLERLSCTNGASFNELANRKYHVGRRNGGSGGGEDEDAASEIYSDATKRADDMAFLMKVRDLILACMTREGLDKILARYRAAANQPIEGDPGAVVKELGSRFTLSDEEEAAIIRRLASDGEGYTRFGLSQAITAHAGEAADYDRASELEEIGGRVITLADSDWKVISKAAA